MRPGSWQSRTRDASFGPRSGSDVEVVTRAFCKSPRPAASVSRARSSTSSCGSYAALRWRRECRGIPTPTTPQTISHTGCGSLPHTGDAVVPLSYVPRRNDRRIVRASGTHRSGQLRCAPDQAAHLDEATWLRRIVQHAEGVPRIPRVRSPGADTLRYVPLRLAMLLVATLGAASPLVYLGNRDGAPVPSTEGPLLVATRFFR